MKIIFFIYLFTFLFISCADVEVYSESCDDSNCSENANCKIVGRVVKCECKDGYIGDGFSCKRATESWTKVIGGSASEGSSIIVSDSSDNIYIIGGFTGTTDLDPTDGENSYSSYSCKAPICNFTCGENSICEDGNCRCKDGFRAISGSCVKIECEESCNQYTQYCDEDICVCKTGYTDNGDECVENVCESACRSNEYCDEDGLCVCNENYTEIDNFDTFISKYSPDGVYLWGKVIGGNSVTSVSLDSNDNLYILGRFSGEVDFNFGSREDIHKSEKNITFITKITSSGSYIGTITLDATLANEILIDGEYFYLVGYFEGKTEFGSGKNFIGEIEGASQTFTSTDYRDVFFSKFLLDGKHLWTKVMIGNGSNYANSLAIDSNKNIFIAGSFNNTLDFDPTDKEDIHTSNNQADMFITKFNPAGNYEWTKTIGAGRNDIIFKIKIDPNDDIIIAGTIEDIIIFNDESHSTYGSNDIIIAKLGNNGDELWINIIGGEEVESFVDMDIDSLGNIYYAGTFTGEKIIFPNAIEVTGDSDAFVAKMSNEGKHLWVETLTSSEDWEYFNSVSIDSKDNLLITGIFDGDITLFSDGKDYSTNPEDSDDYFIIKMIQE